MSDIAENLIHIRSCIITVIVMWRVARLE